MKEKIKVERKTSKCIGEETIVDTELFPVSIAKITNFQSENGTQKKAYHTKKDSEINSNSVCFSVRPNGRKGLDVKLN